MAKRQFGIWLLHKKKKKITEVEIILNSAKYKLFTNFPFGKSINVFLSRSHQLCQNANLYKQSLLDYVVDFGKLKVAFGTQIDTFFSHKFTFEKLSNGVCFKS